MWSIFLVWIFFPKFPNITNIYLYYSQAESTHFGTKKLCVKIYFKNLYKFYHFCGWFFVPKNVLILLVNNIYIGNIRIFWIKKICMKTWYSSKIFMNFINFSFLIYYPKNCSNTPNPYTTHIICLILSFLYLFFVSALKKKFLVDCSWLLLFVFGSLLMYSRSLHSKIVCKLSSVLVFFYILLFSLYSILFHHYS